MLRCPNGIQSFIYILSCIILSFSTALTIDYNSLSSFSTALSIAQNNDLASELSTVPSHTSISSFHTINKLIEPTLGAISSSPPVPAYPSLQCNINNNGSETDCDNYQNLPLLSDLLLQNILEQFPDSCNATILANGFINLSNNNNSTNTNNNKSTILKNATLTYPSLLIQCSNDTLSDRPYHAMNNNFTQFLIDIANNYTLDKVNDDSTSMVYKDKFTDSVLLIVFSQTALCVASWMLFLVLLLLPSNNYNNRNILVHIYVLFYSIIQSVYLGKAYSTTFKFQYENCIQDASRYHKEIIHLTSHKILEVFINILSTVNWFYMIIFMYTVDVSRNSTKDDNNNNNHTNTKLSTTSRKNSIVNQIKNWIFNSKYPYLVHILVIGTILLIINNVFYAVVIWNYSRVRSRIINKVSELIIFALLFLSMCSLIVRNFGMTIASTKQLDSLNSDDNDSILNHNHQTYTSTKDNIFRTTKLYFKRFKKWISIIWKDYHDTVPLLIYNILVFLFSFYMAIYFTAKQYFVYRWKYNLLHFTKLLITVNFWGLIGVFRRREIFLNKKTIIGRKINNKDKLFIDPTVNYDLNRSPSILSSDGFSELNGSDSDNSNNNINNNIDSSSPKLNKSPKFSLVKPLHSVISKFNTTKQRRTRFATENKITTTFDNSNSNSNNNIVQGTSYNNNASNNNSQSVLFESGNDSIKHDLLIINTSYDNSNMNKRHRNNTRMNGQDMNSNDSSDSEDTELESNYIFNTS